MPLPPASSHPPAEPASDFTRWNLLSVVIALANIVICARMYFAGAFNGGPQKEVFFHWGAFTGARAVDGELWRFFTALFVHFGLRHMLGNLCALFMITPFLVSAIGNLPVALIFVACGWIGNATAAATDPYALVAGASGAIFGLYGGLVAVYLSGKFGGHSDLDQRQLRKALWLSVPLSLLTSSLPGISVAANLGGLVTGCLLGYSLTRRSLLYRHGLALFSIVVGIIAIFTVTSVMQGKHAKIFNVLAAKPASLPAQVLAYGSVLQDYHAVHARVLGSIEKIIRGKITEAEFKHRLEQDAIPALGQVLAKLRALSDPRDRQITGLLNTVTSSLELERGYYISLESNPDGVPGIERIVLPLNREAGRISQYWKALGHPESEPERVRSR